MRYSEKEIKQALHDIEEKLKPISTEVLLPMPHNIENHLAAITFKEWLEWKLRHDRYHEREPQYKDGFIRPSRNTTDKVWKLLEKYGFQKETIFAYHYTTFIEKKDEDERNFAAQQGFVIVLHAFIMKGYGRLLGFTYLRFFNALCRGFSDQYRKQYKESEGSIDTVWDMRDDTVKRCRRDLMLTGVDPKKLWKAVVDWKENPFFSVEEDGEGKIKLIKLNQRRTPRGRFLSCIKDDPNYAKEMTSGVNVLFADKTLPVIRPIRCKVCAERRYQVVTVNKKSDGLLELQESVILYLKTSNFNEDYRSALEGKNKALAELKRLGVDASLVNLPNAPRKLHVNDANSQRPKTIWSKRSEHIYYRSIELGILQACDTNYKSVKITKEEATDWSKLGRCNRRIADFETWVKEYGQKNMRKCIIHWLRASTRRFNRAMGQLGANTKLMPISPELMFFKVEKAMRDWRGEVRARLDEYNAANLHLITYRNVYKEVKDSEEDFVKIRSGFQKLINRRYQPIHFWPTTVTAKDRHQIGTSDTDEEDDDDAYPAPEEGEEANRVPMLDSYQTGAKETDEEADYKDKAPPMLPSYRQRWFKAKDPQTDNYCNLVGYDISSSQMQIIAAFLGDKGLMKITMTPPDEPSFKERMAAWVWQMHEEGRLKLRSGRPQIEDYANGEDPRLRELVKELLMRVSYGSSLSDVERDQRLNPKVYGPGWERGSAPKPGSPRKPGSACIFLKAFDKKYPGPKKFREMCRMAAELSWEQDAYQGLVEGVNNFV